MGAFILGFLLWVSVPVQANEPLSPADSGCLVCKQGVFPYAKLRSCAQCKSKVHPRCLEQNQRCPKCKNSLNAKLFLEANPDALLALDEIRSLFRKNQKFWKEVLEGIDVFEDSKMARAIQEFKELVKKDPKDLESLVIAREPALTQAFLSFFKEVLEEAPKNWTFDKTIMGFGAFMIFHSQLNFWAAISVPDRPGVMIANFVVCGGFLSYGSMALLNSVFKVPQMPEKNLLKEKVLKVLGK